MSILTTIRSMVVSVSSDAGFDAELLNQIRVSAAFLSTVGVEQFTNLSIDENTTWPDFEGNISLEGLCQGYIKVRVQSFLDRTTNPTYQASIDKDLEQIIFCIQSLIAEGET